MIIVMKQVSKRKVVAKNIRKNLDAIPHPSHTLILDKYPLFAEAFLRDHLPTAMKFINEASGIIEQASPSKGTVSPWIRILLLNGRALCSAYSKQYDKALQEIGQCLPISNTQGQQLHWSLTMNYSHMAVVHCMAGKLDEAARYSKMSFEHMDSINLSHQPEPSITAAIRTFFECLFHLLSPTLMPAEMQEAIVKAYGLSITLNGSGHRLTKAIEKCVNQFHRDAAKKKITTTESEGVPMARNSNSGSGSRMKLGRKDRSLRTRYHADRSSNLREDTFRVRQQQHGDTVQPRHLVDSPFKRRDLMEIYSGEKPRHRTHKIRKQAEQPEQMRDLQKIKKLYQPANSMHPIQYYYQPGLLEKTSKFEFLMIPIDKSITLDDQKKLGIDQNKERRENLSSVMDNGGNYLKKMTDAKTSIQDHRKTPMPIKKNIRIGIKTKRNTHTPTLITLSSMEDIDRSPEKDSGNVSVRKTHKHKRRQECSLI